MIKIYWDNDMSEWWSLEIPDLIPSWQPSVVQTVSKASLHFPLDNIPKKVNQYLYLKDFFWVEQACKSRSYANPKLSPTNWPTHRRGCSLKCGATSVAKKRTSFISLIKKSRRQELGWHQLQLLLTLLKLLRNTFLKNALLNFIHLYPLYFQKIHFTKIQFRSLFISLSEKSRRQEFRWHKLQLLFKLLRLLRNTFFEKYTFKLYLSHWSQVASAPAAAHTLKL